MIFGYKCSLLEGYDNRSALKGISEYSLFHEMTSKGMNISISGISIWRTLFKGLNYNISLTKGCKNDDILSSIMDNELTIHHSGFYDKFVHIYGADSRDAKQELFHYLRKVLSIIKSLSEIDKNTLVLVTGDHGSFRNNHGYDTYVESTMPMFAFTNFDGLFTENHWPNDPENRDYVFRVKQYDIAPTLALLLGSNINKSSEGDLIGEFFRDANNSEYLQCYYDLNARHLKSIIDRRLFDLDSDEEFDYMVEESGHQKSMSYARYLLNLPKNNVFLLKYIVIMSISLMLLTLFGNTPISIYLALTFLICGALFIHKFKILFSIMTVIFLLAIPVILYEKIISFCIAPKRAIFDIKNVLIIVKIYAMLMSCIPYAFSKYSATLRIIITNLIFILPSLTISLIIPLKNLKWQLVLQYLCLMLISALIIPFSREKPTFYNQKSLYMIVDSNKGIVLSYFVAFITMLQLYLGRRNQIFTKLYGVHIAMLLILILASWTMRDAIGVYNNDSRAYFAYMMYVTHIYCIIVVISALIYACHEKDIFIFYDISIATIIGTLLAIYQINYCLVFITLILFVRAVCVAPRLIEASIPLLDYFQDLKRILTVRKVILFNFVFFYKQTVDILFYLVGRSNSIHDIYDIVVILQYLLSQKNEVIIFQNKIHPSCHIKYLLMSIVIG
ncbi:MAG: hypothetical protein MHMPM18_002488 [Marteilia pararefringens]